MVQRARIAANERRKAHRCRADRPQDCRSGQMSKDPNHREIINIAHGIAERDYQDSEREENRERRQQPLTAILREDSDGAMDVNDARAWVVFSWRRIIIPCNSILSTKSRLQMSFALDNPISYLLIVVVVGWGTALFCGFGLMSRGNPMALIALAFGSRGCERIVPSPGPQLSIFRVVPRFVGSA